MYQNIKPYYNNNDISQRNQQYYEQVLLSKTRGMSPHRTYQLTQVPQPRTSNDITPPVINHSPISMESSLVNKRESLSVSRSQRRIISPSKLPNFEVKETQRSRVSQSLQQTDPQRYKALQQRSQLFQKLQVVTLGLPIKQNTVQTQLLSKQYILPHYKSDIVSTLQKQEKKIKFLTAQMLENQKMISKISRTKDILADRVDRIRQIDQQIYNKLDQDKSLEIEGYLRMAKNLLAEGESEEKIIAVLRKVLY